MHEDEAEAVIRAGPFLMGRWERDLFAKDAEKPARIVTLKAFAIDVHPVTNRRFRAFVEAKCYARPDFWSREGWRWLQSSGARNPMSFDKQLLAGDAHPACGVSWYEAEAFCQFAGRRLPTSAEWERAARGQDGRVFPWGPQPSLLDPTRYVEPLPNDFLCNFDDARGATTPIGTYPQGISPHGLHDTAGNVNNWVQDVYWKGFGPWCAGARSRLHDPSLSASLAERLGVDPGKRTDRGGGLLTAATRFEVLSTTHPLGWDPGSRDVWHGFRTARSLDVPTSRG